MVKIKSPLFSEKASGTISKNITFSFRETGQQVRFQKKQKDKKSDKQIIQRQLYLEAVSAWNLLNPTQKAQFTRSAKGQNLTGYNLFIQIYLNQNPISLDLAIYGIGIYGITIYGDF